MSANKDCLDEDFDRAGEVIRDKIDQEIIENIIEELKEKGEKNETSCN